MSRGLSLCLTVPLCVFLPWLAVAQESKPGEADLRSAYEALAKKDYDAAIDRFQAGLAIQPANAGAHKDLAYTYLKAGETIAARDQFEISTKLNEKDETAALEFAFLCYETKEPVKARRQFERLRHSVNPKTKATAAQAFENIDKPLRDGIARWKQALATAANANDISTFSAHFELAQLAEQRDELALAAEQFQICHKMKPALTSLLVDVARLWKAQGRVELAQAALLAASRGTEPRAAVRALNLFGSRYPYPYEFAQALDLDPQNIALRRELAFLYLAINKKPEAIEQFKRVLTIQPNDKESSAQLAALESKPEAPVALQPAADRKPVAVDPKLLGLKSLSAGYTHDAIKYLQIANETDPNDEEVALKLGWAYNLGKDDTAAAFWFNKARHSSNPQIAKEAQQAWHNLTSNGQPKLTVWLLPMYSTRWTNAFGYGQVKYTLPFQQFLPRRTPVNFYVSTRLVGDLKGGQLSRDTGLPQYFSESSLIFGVGASTRTWHRLTGWVEAGQAVKYLPSRRDVGASIPDYRGGVNFAWARGHLAGSQTSGFFYETTADAIYISRFDKDWLFYSQHRLGRTMHPFEGGFVQALWNVNVTQDIKKQYWANTIEVGPGLRWRLPGMPTNAYFSTDFLRGIYTNNVGNPRRPNFNDIRVGMWYAFSK